MKSTAWSRRPVEVRFWEKVTKGDGCWEWLGARVTKGHGVFKGPRGQTGAHRFAWELAFGPIPKGVGYHGTCVCHKCDNPGCVRPDHLFLGTIQDNLSDMRSKGREKRLSGDDHPWRKRPDLIRRGSQVSNTFTESDIKKIRRRLASGETQISVASEYGVHQATISMIHTRRTWSHVS